MRLSCVQGTYRDLSLGGPSALTFTTFAFIIGFVTAAFTLTTLAFSLLSLAALAFTFGFIATTFALGMLACQVVAR